jgi:hypothetical protein
VKLLVHNLRSQHDLALVLRMLTPNKGWHSQAGSEQATTRESRSSPTSRCLELATRVQHINRVLQLTDYVDKQPVLPYCSEPDSTSLKDLRNTRPYAVQAACASPERSCRNSRCGGVDPWVAKTSSHGQPGSKRHNRKTSSSRQRRSPGRSGPSGSLKVSLFAKLQLDRAFCR